jgi:hypothetical protein
MKILTTLAVGLVAVLVQSTRAAELPQRNPEALRGITSVKVVVRDEGTPGLLPPEAVVRREFEDLLRERCHLTIDSRDPSAEVHVDMHAFRSLIREDIYFANFRTTIWRLAVPTDSKGVPLPSKKPVKMAVWLASAPANPNPLDPLYKKPLEGQADLLAATLGAAGERLLPASVSIDVFEARRESMRTRLQELINAKLDTAPLKNLFSKVDPDATNVEVKLDFSNGYMFYSFDGHLKAVALPPTGVAFEEEIHSKRELDVAGLSALRTLPAANLCLEHEKLKEPLCVKFEELFK